MLGSYKFVIDTFSEIYQNLTPPVCTKLPLANGQPFQIDKTYWDFAREDIEPNTIYVVGREQAHANAEKVKHILDNGVARIIYSSPSEGSQTLIGHTRHAGLEHYLLNGSMLAIGGGGMGSEYNHMFYDHFLPKIYDYPQNVTECGRTEEIFYKVEKPYNFLFLNGRTRPHRRWLLHYCKNHGLLERCLWTNLDSHVGYSRSLPYENETLCNLQDPLPVQSLPPQYEVSKFHKNIKTNYNQSFIKYELFNINGQVEWGDAYINAQCYIDTYFSLVTETVFDYPHSFRTEKIWKPIAMGHPWIAVANSGFYKDIQALGFKTFGSIIDESFDQETDSVARIRKIARLISDLCSSQTRLRQFLVDSYEICMYNKELLRRLRHQVRENFAGDFVNAVTKWTT